MRQEHWSAFETDHARFFSQRFYKKQGCLVLEQIVYLTSKNTDGEVGCRGMGSAEDKSRFIEICVRVHWLSLVQERVRRSPD